ncbi:MAG: hypothetical protein ACNA70_03930 [Brevefilum sp.]
MGDYARRSRELSLEALPGEVRAAIQRHREANNLGPILDDYEMCMETVSVRRKWGLFKRQGGRQVTSYAILTPTWLVYAVTDPAGVTSALSVKLEDATVEDYASSPIYAKMPDSGFHVTGNFTGQVGMHGRQQVSIFLGLGEERAAVTFGEALMDAIANTRR